MTIHTLIHRLLAGAEHFANEAKPVLESLFLPNAFAPAAEGWVQLSPFGDFGNRDAKKQRVVQRFRKEDAEAICNEFNSVARKITQPFGMPFYVGHPDHPSFKGQPGHTDTSAKGRGKEFAVRHAADCAKCADFANSGLPCGEHGLFVKMHWNHAGEEIIANEEFHGHSVNWAAVPAGMEGGVRIMRPIRVKSAGFTNEPNIPVTPAQLANEEQGEEEVANAAGEIVPPKLKVLAGFQAEDDVTMEQVIAALEKAREGAMANENPDFFFANGDVAGHPFRGNQYTASNAAMKTSGPANEATAAARASDSAEDHAAARDSHEAAFMAHHAAQQEAEGRADKATAEFHQSVKYAHAKQAFQHGLDERRSLKNANRKIANQASLEASETALANEKTGRTAAETAFANERRERATLLADAAIKAGRKPIGEREAIVEALCNAGDKFDEQAALLANAAVTIKTTAKSGGLAGQHAKLETELRTRSAKFQALMESRAEEFPNEGYEQRFEFVANSAEGAPLIAQMQRAGSAAADAKD